MHARRIGDTCIECLQPSIGYVGRVRTLLINAWKCCPLPKRLRLDVQQCTRLVLYLCSRLAKSLVPWEQDYLFFVCLYVKRFRVLYCQQSPVLSRFGPYIRCELSKLVPYHILRDPHIRVVLPIVHLEDQADKVGQDRGSACLRLHWCNLVSRLRSHDWQSSLMLATFLQIPVQMALNDRLDVRYNMRAWASKMLAAALCKCHINNRFDTFPD